MLADDICPPEAPGVPLEDVSIPGGPGDVVADP